MDAALDLIRAYCTSMIKTAKCVCNVRNLNLYISLLCTSLAMSVLEVKFIGDTDVLEHIVDKQEGMDDTYV